MFTLIVLSSYVNLHSHSVIRFPIATYLIFLFFFLYFDTLSHANIHTHSHYFFPLWDGQGLGEPLWCAPEKTDNVAVSKEATGLEVCGHYK